MKATGWVWRLLGLAALVTVLTACGGDSPEEAATPGTARIGAQGGTLTTAGASVEVPVGACAEADGAQVVMITADPGETTSRVLSAATLLDGVMRAPVMQFSCFQVVSPPAVRMPVLQTQVHRMTNTSFPGAQQVPAGTEIAGQVPVAAPLIQPRVVAIPSGLERASGTEKVKVDRGRGASGTLTITWLFRLAR